MEHTPSDDDEILALLRPAPASTALTGDVLPPAQVQSEPAKAKPEPWNKGKGIISKKLRTALRHLADGHTVTDAAAKAGMSRTGLHDALVRPHVIEMLEGLTRSTLASAAARGAARIDHLIDKAKSEYVQLEAAKAAIGSQGMLVKQTALIGGQINVEIKL